MKRKLRLMWCILRGRAVMYRIAIVADADRIYVGSALNGRMHVTENKAYRKGSAEGEVLCFDLKADMAYPLYVSGPLP